MRDSLSSSQNSLDTETSNQDKEKQLTRMQQFYLKAKSFKIKKRSNTVVSNLDATESLLVPNPETLMR